MPQHLSQFALFSKGQNQKRPRVCSSTPSMNNDHLSTLDHFNVTFTLVVNLRIFYMSSISFDI